MGLRSFLIRPPVVAAVMVCLTACGASDPSPPWDTKSMVRDLTSELRRFEGLATDFDEIELLAWRVDARDQAGPVVEIALLWGRTGTADAPTGWALVQGYRHPEEGDTWRRSLYIRELRSLLTHPRPGEDACGTWHAYRRYDHAPTVREICDFAAVDFFSTDKPGGYRRVSRALRHHAWLRVAVSRAVASDHRYWRSCA
jgi:hypothetical protein